LLSHPAIAFGNHQWEWKWSLPWGFCRLKYFDENSVLKEWIVQSVKRGFMQFVRMLRITNNLSVQNVYKSMSKRSDSNSPAFFFLNFRTRLPKFILLKKICCILSITYCSLVYCRNVQFFL
jgi:hypothetical protein